MILLLTVIIVWCRILSFQGIPLSHLTAWQKHSIHPKRKEQSCIFHLWGNIPFQKCSNMKKLQQVIIHQFNAWLAWENGRNLVKPSLASPQISFGVRSSRIHFTPTWGRNECVTNEPQRTYAGRLSHHWFPLETRHFRNKEGTGAEMRRAIISGIVNGGAPVSYWPVFFPCPW